MDRRAPLMKRLLLVDAAVPGIVDWQQEIAESLSHVFNTHQGSAMVAADFGLPDFNPEALSIHSLHHYEQQMKTLIHKYEPRFKAVQVESQFDTEQKHRLIFHFRGFLEEMDSTQKIHYYSLMTDHGRVTMQAAA